MDDIDALAAVRMIVMDATNDKLWDKKQNNMLTASLSLSLTFPLCALFPSSSPLLLISSCSLVDLRMLGSSRSEEGSSRYHR